MPGEKLIEEQRKYIKERGFEVIEGSPLTSMPFPYVVLMPVEGEFSTMEYRQSPTSATKTGGNCNPTNMETDELVGLVELMIGSNMHLDGVTFSTKPGEPIKVFMQDPVWREVAENLVGRYRK